MSGEFYEALYVCACGERPFQCRYREKTEKVTDWLAQVVRPAMEKTHRRNSPLCLAKTVDLKLPVSDAQPLVGCRVEN